MKFLEKLTKKTTILQRTIGLNLNQFTLLVSRLSNAWEEAEQQRKSHGNRKRKIGAGHPYKFQKIDEKILIVLLYYKLYLTQEFLGMVVDLDQANVSKLLKKMLPLIENAADPELTTYLNQAKNNLKMNNRINNWQDFIKEYPDLKDVSIDATEQSCYRSKNYEQQKVHYSGKKKDHTLKTQISVASTGRILDVSDTCPGSIHDKKIIDQEKTIQKFPERTCQRLDSGYQGVIAENSDHYVVIPTKKPKGKELSDVAKDNNQAHSKRRVIVEHVLSRIKKFRICGNLYRGKTKNYNQMFRNVVAIINFKLAHSALIM